MAAELGKETWLSPEELMEKAKVLYYEAFSAVADSEDNIPTGFESQGSSYTVKLGKLGRVRYVQVVRVKGEETEKVEIYAPRIKDGWGGFTYHRWDNNSIGPLRCNDQAAAFSIWKFFRDIPPLNQV